MTQHPKEPYEGKEESKSLDIILTLVGWVSVQVWMMCHNCVMILIIYVSVSTPSSLSMLPPVRKIHIMNILILLKYSQLLHTLTQIDATFVSLKGAQKRSFNLHTS